MRAERKRPFSHPQFFSSQIFEMVILCDCFFIRRRARSISKPIRMPLKILMPRMAKILDKAIFSESMMGSISSEVERKMEINVPREMTPPAYRLDADAEKPHCGTAPRIPPTAGPEKPAFAVRADVF